METMRNWLRRWFGVEELYDGLSAEQADNEFQNERLGHAYDAIKELQELTKRHSLELNKLRQDYAALSLPAKQQLLQLRSGINILTQFANELQREIEK